MTCFRFFFFKIMPYFSMWSHCMLEKPVGKIYMYGQQPFLSPTQTSTLGHTEPLWSQPDWKTKSSIGYCLWSGTRWNRGHSSPLRSWACKIRQCHLGALQAICPAAQLPRCMASAAASSVPEGPSPFLCGSFLSSLRRGLASCRKQLSLTTRLPSLHVLLAPPPMSQPSAFINTQCLCCSQISVPLFL